MSSSSEKENTSSSEKEESSSSSEEEEEENTSSSKNKDTSSNNSSEINNTPDGEINGNDGEEDSDDDEEDSVSEVVRPRRGTVLAVKEDENPFIVALKGTPVVNIVRGLCCCFGAVFCTCTLGTSCCCCGAFQSLFYYQIYSSVKNVQGSKKE